MTSRPPCHLLLYHFHPVWRGETWQRKVAPPFLTHPFPFILVLYDAKKDIGYWLYIQHFFANLAGFDPADSGRRVIVIIPRSNVLNRGAMKMVGRVKNAAAQQFRTRWTHVIQ